MPGWYIHLDAAREAIAGLNANPRAAAIFASDGGPSAAELQALAQHNPAYFALGAIGPDLFFSRLQAAGGHRAYGARPT